METNTEKTSRKRQKKLCYDIMKQMEFYFSDANLHRDKFLKQHLGDDVKKWVDIEVFSNFNKLRSLTTDMSLVGKALEKSKLIEVDEDHKQIRRVKDLADPCNVDARSIYVECLPATADHTWIKSIFAPFGTVNYVSIPKYKSSGDIRGFAFIEFEEEESARKACEEMNNPANGNTSRAGRFPAGSKEMKSLQRQVREHNILIPDLDNFTPGPGQKVDELITSVATASNENVLKRPRTSSESSDKMTYKKWCKKSGKSDKSDENPCGILEKKGVKRKHKSKEEENGSNDDETSPKKKIKKDKECEKKTSSGKETVVKESKKKRKRTKKKVREENLSQLRVLSKSEWLDLKKEYLELQKGNVAKLKMSLKSAREQKQAKEIVNKNNKEALDTANVKTQKTLEFVPNVLLELCSTKPIVRTQLLECLTVHGEVAYIDMGVDVQKAVVRCYTADHASSITTASLEQYKCRPLEGEEEKLYWEKILEDRKIKLASKFRSKKRGKEKVFSKAQKMSTNKSKHVVFDES